ncbi:hypothetical protein BH20PSE1_BH20PSE1_18920 [soil metagenome]
MNDRVGLSGYALLTRPTPLKEALQKCREQAQMREATERVARHIR